MDNNNERLQVIPLNTYELRVQYQADIAALEKKFSYPLGDSDFFQIDHGSNYFAFFDRLAVSLNGSIPEVHYHIALVDGQLAAVIAAVLRCIPLKHGQSAELVWYICDLKVDPQHRDKRLPLTLFARLANSIAVTKNYPSDELVKAKIYAIAMNSADGQTKLAKFLQKSPWMPMTASAQLAIFNGSADSIFRIQAILERHRGLPTFTSLHGKKDLILRSTGAPMPLLHAQFGCYSTSGLSIDNNCWHMFCVTTADPLYKELCAELTPTAMATILSRNIDSDWKFIVSSEI